MHVNEPQPQYKSTDILSSLQVANRDQDQVIAEAVNGVAKMAEVLKGLPFEATSLHLALMGGIHHQLMLLETLIGKKTLQEMAEVYARGEIFSYCENDDQVRRTCEHYVKLGATGLMIDGCKLPDGTVYKRIRVDSDQKLKDGSKLVKGQVIPNIDREVPPMADLYRYL